MTALWTAKLRHKIAWRKGKPLNELMKNQKGVCFYCKCEMQTHDEKLGTFATRDHRIPLSRGGRMRGRNVVAACQSCNGMKGDMDEADFRVILIIVDNLLKLC